MLTIILECRDNEAELAQTLSALVAGAVEGVVRDVIVLDHGSRDGSSKVADAAGCRFLERWSLDEALGTARGDWILMLEAGARPQNGWIEDVLEHASLSRLPARFSPARRFHRPLFRRLTGRAGVLEFGLLMPKREAAARARPGMDLAALARGTSARKLRSELIPAWVLREG